MRRFGLSIVLISLVLSLTPLPSSAERNLVPSLERDYDICPDRPPEPEWMQYIPLRDAYRRVLVQDIYRAQNLERIVETGDCACETRFPAWDNAAATFREHHADAERWEMLEASDVYNRRANAARAAAKAICEAAGNW